VARIAFATVSPAGRPNRVVKFQEGKVGLRNDQALIISRISDEGCALAVTREILRLTLLITTEEELLGGPSARRLRIEEGTDSRPRAVDAV
jgi:hypothetical protein